MKYLVFMLLVLASQGSFALKVGYSQADITPNESEAMASCLGGYTPFSRCGVTDIHEPITVRTIHFVDRNRSMSLTSIDAIGIGSSYIESIKGSLNSSKPNIDTDFVFIGATHTHHGPDLQGLWGGVSTEYRERVIATVESTIVAASESVEKAKIRTATISAAVANRRGWDVADSDVNFLEFRNKKGESIVTLINMSAHPVIIDSSELTYSPDFVSSLRQGVEANLGTKAIFFNGILGDVVPAGDGDRTTSTADKYGATIAAALIEDGVKWNKVRGGRFKASRSTFTHPVDNPALVGAVEAGLLDVKLNPDNSITTQYGIFHIGNTVSGIIFPGEALSRLGLPLKSYLGKTTELFLGLTGDSLGYFLPSDEYLGVPGVDTEEQFTLHPLIGDAIQTDIFETISGSHCPVH